jgi:hypothetical protein
LHSISLYVVSIGPTRVQGPHSVFLVASATCNWTGPGRFPLGFWLYRDRVQRVRQSYRDVQMKLQSNISHGLASRITGLWSTWDVRL